MSGAHMNDTYLTAEGCRHFAAALAQERLGADEALASTVALAYSPIHKRPRPRGDLYYELKTRQRSNGPLLFRCHTCAELEIAARKALGVYFGLAVAYDDRWYADLFSRALEGDPTPAKVPPFYRRIQLRYQLGRARRGLRGSAYVLGQRVGAVARRARR